MPNQVTVPAKQNSIFFSFEAKRRDFFKTFGGSIDSPNLSRLADQSINFSQMTSPAPSTSMTISGILNGRYPHEFHERYQYRDCQFFPDNLFAIKKQQGIRTFFVIHEKTPEKVHPSIYAGLDAERVFVENEGGPDDHRNVTAMARKVAEIAERCKTPFFILAHCSPPGICDESLKPTWRSNLERVIREDDDAIGILLDRISLDNTRLVVYSDHGVHMGEHGHIFSHRFLPNEVVIQVPCLVSAENKQEVNEPCSLVNLYQLEKDNCFEIPKTIYVDTQYSQQQHRVTAVRQNDWKYIAHYSWHTAINGLQEELYDLQTDPTELRNLLHNIGRHPLHYGTVAEDISEKVYATMYDKDLMGQALQMLRKEVGDIWSAAFLRQLKDKDPNHHDYLLKELEHSSPIDKIAIIAKLISLQYPGEHAYRYDQTEGSPTPPFRMPGHPKGNHCLNFSSLGGFSADKFIQKNKDSV